MCQARGLADSPRHFLLKTSLSRAIPEELVWHSGRVENGVVLPESVRLTSIPLPGACLGMAAGQAVADNVVETYSLRGTEEIRIEDLKAGLALLLATDNQVQLDYLLAHLAACLCADPETTRRFPAEWHQNPFLVILLRSPGGGAWIELGFHPTCGVSGPPLKAIRCPNRSLRSLRSCTACWRHLAVRAGRRGRDHCTPARIRPRQQRRAPPTAGPVSTMAAHTHAVLAHPV